MSPKHEMYFNLCQATEEMISSYKREEVTDETLIYAIHSLLNLLGKAVGAKDAILDPDYNDDY